jgi:mono/diheme cytochrome c family protein
MVGALVVVAFGAAPRQAFAVKEFFDEFKAVYVKPDSSDANEKALVAAVETAKCNVCHAGSSKKERNAYGNALADLLDKKEDKKNAEKIRHALETVAAMPSAAGGPTFEELLKQGKLPGAAAQ